MTLYLKELLSLPNKLVAARQVFLKIMSNASYVAVENAIAFFEIKHNCFLQKVLT